MSAAKRDLKLKQMVRFNKTLLSLILTVRIDIRLRIVVFLGDLNKLQSGSMSNNFGQTDFQIPSAPGQMIISPSNVNNQSKKSTKKRPTTDDQNDNYFQESSVSVMIGLDSKGLSNSGQKGKKRYLKKQQDSTLSTNDAVNN